MSDTETETTIGTEDLEEEEKEIRETPQPEEPAQIWEDALALGLMARILTGRNEFEDSDKMKEILTPSESDTCSLSNGSMMGNLVDALLAGNYNVSAEQALEDILTPMRYAAVCSHLKHNPSGIGGFFSKLFSKNKGNPASYSKIAAEAVVKLLCFHYTTLTLNVPGITIQVLQQFEGAFGAEKPIDEIISLLPEELQKVIRACKQIPEDQINQENIKKYFGGSIPYLLMFNKTALEKAMNLARQNGPNSVSDPSGGSEGLVAYGDSEGSESSESSESDGEDNQVPVGLFSEKTAIKEFFDRKKNNSNTSGRVKYSMEIGSDDSSE